MDSFLVAPSTLICLEDGWGRPVMEMVVESITVDIMNAAGYEVTEVTDNYDYFIAHPEFWNHKVEFEKAFRNHEDYLAYERIFDENYICSIMNLTGGIFNGKNGNAKVYRL